MLIFMRYGHKRFFQNDLKNRPLSRNVEIEGDMNKKVFQYDLIKHIFLMKC